MMVDHLGYAFFFALTAGMGIPVIILILLIWRPYQALVAHR
jgi:hypothetical protein